jgi:hypothetical protein
LHAAEFAGVEIVGLTAGTSTLPETVQAAHARLLGFATNSTARRPNEMTSRLKILLRGMPTKSAGGWLSRE